MGWEIESMLSWLFQIWIRLNEIRHETQCLKFILLLLPGTVIDCSQVILQIIGGRKFKHETTNPEENHTFSEYEKEYDVLKSDSKKISNGTSPVERKPAYWKEYWVLMESISTRQIFSHFTKTEAAVQMLQTRRKINDVANDRFREYLAHRCHFYN